MTTWTAPTVDRTQPERMTGERQALEQWLDYHRETLLFKCAGLTAEQLKQRPSPPSTLSLLGLVRHMTEVERWWFCGHAAKSDYRTVYCAHNEMADFDELDGADAGANLETFRQVCDEARKAVVDVDLDDVVPSLGDHPERTRNVRWIYVHMIEEYARHNGHADLLREAIDGTTGD